jgi:hypothetical protein
LGGGVQRAPSRCIGAHRAHLVTPASKYSSRILLLYVGRSTDVDCPASIVVPWLDCFCLAQVSHALARARQRRKQGEDAVVKVLSNDVGSEAALSLVITGVDERKLEALVGRCVTLCI